MSDTIPKNPFTRPMRRPILLPFLEKIEKRGADGRHDLPRTSSIRSRFNLRAWPGRCGRCTLITLGTATPTAAAVSAPRSTPSAHGKAAVVRVRSVTSTRTLRSLVRSASETPGKRPRQISVPAGLFQLDLPRMEGPARPKQRTSALGSEDRKYRVPDELGTLFLKLSNFDLALNKCRRGGRRRMNTKCRLRDPPPTRSSRDRDRCCLFVCLFVSSFLCFVFVWLCLCVRRDLGLLFWQRRAALCGFHCRSDLEP